MCVNETQLIMKSDCSSAVFDSKARINLINYNCAIATREQIKYVTCQFKV